MQTKLVIDVAIRIRGLTHRKYGWLWTLSPQDGLASFKKCNQPGQCILRMRTTLAKSLSVRQSVTKSCKQRYGAWAGSHKQVSGTKWEAL